MGPRVPRIFTALIAFQLAKVQVRYLLLYFSRISKTENFGKIGIKIFDQMKIAKLTLNSNQLNLNSN